jgi:hypothetical protein
MVPGGLLMLGGLSRSGEGGGGEEDYWTSNKFVLLRTEMHHLTRQVC